MSCRIYLKESLIMTKNKHIQNKNKLSNEDFLKWITIAEKSPTMSLETFNKKWEEKKLEIYKNYQL